MPNLNRRICTLEKQGVEGFACHETALALEIGELHYNTLSLLQRQAIDAFYKQVALELGE